MNTSYNRYKILDELTNLLVTYKDILDLPNIDDNEPQKDDIYLAFLVEYLKQIEHKIINDLEEVGLIEYYDSVMHYYKNKVLINS